MRGIIEFNLDHGRSLEHRDPEHGRLVGRHWVVLVRGFVHVVVTCVDGEGQGDVLELGAEADGRGSAQH
jgi:hypothetical protein